ncbi:MAG: hypothetical protein ATN35_12675 [Epulopiscium sp. Nele67-Bin004]|nr:MAG: hypothetical protein ATN35_12675 [Epulopiscium sp. Nele67-Bin004]
MGDVAEIITQNKEQQKIIQQLIVRNIPSDKKANYLITIMDVVKVVQKKYKDANIIPLGETDSMVQYEPTQPKPNKLWELTKVLGICLVVFAGSSVAIMAYQVDTSFAKTLSMLYKVFTGEVDPNPEWITVPFSLGMPIGVLLFFNHIGFKKITNDPTPIEVEIDVYEDEIDTTIIDVMANNRREGQKPW